MFLHSRVSRIELCKICRHTGFEMFCFSFIAETAAKKEDKSDEKETDGVAEKLSEMKVKDDEKKDEGEEKEKKSESSSDVNDKDTVER